MTSASSPLKIAQSYAYEGGGWWNWSVWVEGPEALLAEIEKVVYLLHPTFPRPVRTVTNRDTKFRLDEGGWGYFRLKADVVFKGNRPGVKLVHDLELKHADAEEVHGGPNDGAAALLTSRGDPGFDDDGGGGGGNQAPTGAEEPSLPPIEVDTDAASHLQPVRLFISHRGGASTAALNEFRHSLLAHTRGRLSVKLSADFERIAVPGSTWLEQVEAELDRTDLMAVLYTPPGGAPDWPLYEWGYFKAAAAGSASRRAIVVRTPWVTVPLPLTEAQTYVADRSDVGRLLHELFTSPLREGAQPLAATCPQPERLSPLIDAVLRAAGSGRDTPVSIDFVARLRVTIAADDTGLLQRNVIPGLARVSGDRNAMEAVGMACVEPDARTWELLLSHIRNGPGDERSMTEWARIMGKAFGAAARYERPHASLPTFCSPVNDKVYRPAMSRLNKPGDGSCEYELSLIEFPPELSTWPSGGLGAVSQVLTLVRVFRWGVLIPFWRRFTLAASNNKLTPHEVDAAYRQLEAAIENVYIDAHNRGVDQSSTRAAMPPESAEELDRLALMWEKVMEAFNATLNRQDKSLDDALPILRRMGEINKQVMDLFGPHYYELLKAAAADDELARTNRSA